MEEALWRSHRERLFRFVVQRVEDEPTAEDIVHDVLVRAYEKRDTLRHGEKFERWLYQITRNAVIDHYRARRPAEELPVDLPAPDASGGPNAIRELSECLAPLIEALPRKYQDALVLSEIEGITQKETAKRLGLTHSGAKSRVARGRRMLEQSLLDCCRFEFDHRGSLVDFEPRGAGSEGTPSEGSCEGC